MKQLFSPDGLLHALYTADTNVSTREALSPCAALYWVQFRYVGAAFIEASSYKSCFVQFTNIVAMTASSKRKASSDAPFSTTAAGRAPESPAKRSKPTHSLGALPSGIQQSPRQDGKLVGGRHAAGSCVNAEAGSLPSRRGAINASVAVAQSEPESDVYREAMDYLRERLLNPRSPKAATMAVRPAVQAVVDELKG